MMHNLIRRIVLWLCDRYYIVPVTDYRTNMGPDKLARSQRWEAFATEQGGLYDLIDILRREAFEAYSAQPPSAHAERDYLAMTDRNLRALKSRVAGVIAEGKIETTRAAAKETVRIVKSI